MLPEIRHIGIVGLGYVGLPLAVAFAQAGFRVTGIDTNAEKVAAVNHCESYIGDIQSTTLTELSRWITATTTFSALDYCDAVVICVPTPLNKDGNPDVSYIIHAVDEVALHLHWNMLIVLESTTYPGTTTEIVLPRLLDRHLEVGKDFYLCFSPERVDPGRKDWTIRTTPKVIGGITPRCLEVGTALYEEIVDTVVPVSSTESAEMVKLLENTFRAVNIALANEMLLICERLGLDAWEVINAAATKPFGFMKFTPGPGVGGHCIPIDPLYLSWKLKSLKFKARFIELADEINSSMPAYWVGKVQDALNSVGKPLKGSWILVLGVAYKPNVNDMRESPALDIMHLLAEKGAEVNYHDPHVPVLWYHSCWMPSIDNLYEALIAADCVVIVTDHAAYDWEKVERLAKVIVDTRNVLNKKGENK